MTLTLGFSPVPATTASCSTRSSIAASISRGWTFTVRLADIESAQLGRVRGEVTSPS
jgi:hypothetical protein